MAVIAAAMTAFAACGSADSSSITGSIQMQAGQVLRLSGDTLDFTEETQLLRDGRGDFVAVRVASNAGFMIAALDSAGVPRKLAGRKGNGPGEFQHLSGAGIGPGDSLFIGDVASSRLSVLSPAPELRFVRSLSVPFALAVFRSTPQGRLSGPSVTRDGPQPIRLTAWDESRTTVLAADVPMNRVGAMTLTKDGRLWVADRLKYELALWSDHGVERRLTRSVEWFPPDTTPITMPAWMGKGRPFITALDADEDGLLWVLIKRKNPHWTGEGPPPRPGMSISGFPPLDRIFEGVLEVLDAKTGALIDSRIVGGDVIAFIGPHQLYQKIQDDSTGAIRMQIWNVSLQRSR